MHYKPLQNSRLGYLTCICYIYIVVALRLNIRQLILRQFLKYECSFKYRHYIYIHLLKSDFQIHVNVTDFKPN